MSPPERTRSGNVKGNTGESARRRSQKRVAAYTIGVLVALATMSTVYQSRLAGIFVPDVDFDESGRGRVRRRRYRQKQLKDPNKQTTSEDAILEGFLTMTGLYVPPTALQGVGKQYTGIKATFCKVDWELQRKNPSEVPMFRDMQKRSIMCEDTSITVDLWDIVQKSIDFDAKFHNTTNIIAVPPTGVVFHESRCGSTLVANMLAGFAPPNVRVYSECMVPLNALKACDVNPCYPVLHNKLIQDVFYMLGRTNRKQRPQFVFYKMSSIGTMFIDKFTEAMPETPWMYLYRDTIQVMQSNLAKRRGSLGSSMVAKPPSPPCIRLMSAKQQPVTTLQVLKPHDREIDSLSKEEYCAAHLGGLSLSAIYEHRRSGKGRFVNYKQLPQLLWDKLLPEVFGVGVNDAEKGRMRDIALVYSKDRGKKKEWKEDGKMKTSMATLEVVKAAQLLVGDIYEEMESYSLQD